MAPVLSGKLDHAAYSLRQLGEDGLIERIQSILAAPGRMAVASRPSWGGMEVLVAIGDDTALVRPHPQAPAMALTTDMMVEGVHFLPDHPPEELGAKCIASNLSDLAAVGAWPAWVLVSLGAPGDTPAEWVEAVYRGMRHAMAPYGCLCLGGDCVRSPYRVINIALGGNCDPAAAPPLRNRLRANQRIYVTGTLGDSGAGLRLLEEGACVLSDSSERDYLIRRHRRPEPRIEAGMQIARLCPDAAMMDLSDGLAVDLPRMTLASGCGAEVRVDCLPLSRPLRRMAEFLNEDPVHFALFGGEDYELLFATSEPPEHWHDAVASAREPRLRITCVGRVVESPGVRYVDRGGRSIALTRGGFSHF